MRRILLHLKTEMACNDPLLHWTSSRGVDNRQNNLDLDSQMCIVFCFQNLTNLQASYFWFKFEPVWFTGISIKESLVFNLKCMCNVNFSLNHYKLSNLSVLLCINEMNSNKCSPWCMTWPSFMSNEIKSKYNYLKIRIVTASFFQIISKF